MQEGLGGKKVFELEDGLLRRFKRQYYQYSTSNPEDNNFSEWYSLMQHYGAPTRFLDWTYSFFVAIFFAIEELEEDECVVLALNHSNIV